MAGDAWRSLLVAVICCPTETGVCDEYDDESNLDGENTNAA